MCIYDELHGTIKLISHRIYNSLTLSCDNYFSFLYGYLKTNEQDVVDKQKTYVPLKFLVKQML